MIDAGAEFYSALRRRSSTALTAQSIPLVASSRAGDGQACRRHVMFQFPLMADAPQFWAILPNSDVRARRGTARSAS